MRRLAFLLALVVLSVAHAAPGAAPLADLGFKQHPGALLPYDAPLVDETGQATTLRAVSERAVSARAVSGRAVSGGLPLVIVPGYFRCPNLCGTVRDDVLSTLGRSGLVAGRDYALAAVTIDPSETPATAAAVRREDLARYPLPGGDADVHYLTGLGQSLGAIADAEGFPVRYDDKLKQFMHPAGRGRATRGGVGAGSLRGGGSARDARRAAVEQARQGVSGIAQPILLLCFHFDATTGRYTLAVMKVLRLAGILTILTIGGVIWLAHRSGRRREGHP